MNRQCLWFVVKEGVCRERGTDIHDEVVYGTVSGVHDVGLVLQQVVDALNNASLAEHDFVPHGHEPVLHISPQSVYKMNTPVKEVLEECLLDVAPVGEDLPIEFLGKYRPYPFVSVVHIRTCKTECYNLPAVVAHQVQFESVAPSHRPFPVHCHIPEDLVGIASQVVAHRYHRGVHETDAAALAEALKFHEEHHVKEDAWSQFHKPIIRDSIREIAGKMLPHIEEVVVLEIGE